MTPLHARLAEIEGRCKAATPGPWTLSSGWRPDRSAIVDTQNVYGEPPAGVVAKVVMASQDGKHTKEKAANADFMAHARTDIPFLLAALKASLGALEALEHAEDVNANCEDCEGDGVPELCASCFPFFDEARLKRRAALAPPAPSPTRGA